MALCFDGFHKLPSTELPAYLHSTSMSPGKLLSQPSFKLTPIKPSQGKKCNFGAVAEGLDLNDIAGKAYLMPHVIQESKADFQEPDDDVKALSDAIWAHKLVVVRGQKNLAPAKQWELVTRFDPDAPQVHSHGDLKSFKSKGGVLAVRILVPPYQFKWLLT
jgi:xanthine dioxygenase